MSHEDQYSKSALDRSKWRRSPVERYMIGYILSLSVLLSVAKLPFTNHEDGLRSHLNDRHRVSFDAFDLQAVHLQPEPSIARPASAGANYARDVLPQTTRDEHLLQGLNAENGAEAEQSERALQKMAARHAESIDRSNAEESLQRRLLSYVEPPRPSTEPRLKLGTIAVNYPRAAIRAEIQGRVLLSFVVEPDGRAYNIAVEQSLHPLCDREALRALREARFHPAEERGKPVPAVLELAIRFVLNGDV